jgi:antitoxin CcdA
MIGDALAGVERAIAAAGGVKSLANAVGVSHVSVIGWRSRGAIPPSRVAAVAQATGLSPAELRPDLFAAGRPGFAEAQAPFDVSPPVSLHAEATALGLDADAIAENALREAIRAEKARRWLEENREAIEAHNRWVDEHGLPLAEYRMF